MMVEEVAMTNAACPGGGAPKPRKMMRCPVCEGKLELVVR
jgi:uncharacterized Zn finger protein (UPF0148 family)